MKYKYNEDGSIAVDSDGHPIRISASGEEYSFDALKTKSKLAEVMTEAKGYRQEKSALKAQLEAIPEDIRNNPKSAQEALVTVSNLGTQHKVDMETLKGDLKASYETVISEKDNKIKTLEDSRFNDKVTTRFAVSESLKGTIFEDTREVAESYFGQHFKMNEEGKVVASGHDGKTIYSSKSPGEPAGFDEALSTIIQTHPKKDSLLAASGQRGSGGPPNGSGVGETRKSSREKIASGIANRKAS